jgi:superfamily II DNA or RNA helicase
VLTLDIPYKVGFSGTIYFDEKRTATEEDIWLRAIAGPIVFSISMRELIDLGYLVEPEIHFVPFKETLEAPNYQSAYKELLEHPRRNSRIVEIAAMASRSGHKTIIVTNRITQADLLGELLKAAGINREVLTGPDDLSVRRKAFNEFCDPASSLRVLVGTVFNETVDLPPADVVINASGGMSRGGTIQKLRNLTAHKGKDRAIVFDFADVGHKDFKRHSRERKRHYRAEGLACSLLKRPVEEIL